MTLTIPEKQTPDEVFPGDLQPGTYTHQETVDLLRDHRNDPSAIQFIADMLE